MITANLYNEVIVTPYANGARQLYVVSGFSSPAMVLRQLEEQPDVSISLLIGMVTAGGLRVRDHLAFQRISEEYQNRFSCRYINESFSVHSKTFAWLNPNGLPSVGFVGSANYTQMGFSSPRQQEAIERVEPDEPMAYYDALLPSSVSCMDPNIENIFNFDETIQPQVSANNVVFDDSSPECIHLPLTMMRSGEVVIHEKSGLNWGQRAGREPNQAYLPIPSSIYQGNFFPEIGVSFVVYTDDGEVLHCRRAQENGKAIHTYNNSDLGRYFRQRLGVGDGEFVTLDHLDNYGRRDVEICKIDDESYYLNFSQS